MPPTSLECVEDANLLLLRLTFSRRIRTVGPAGVTGNAVQFVQGVVHGVARWLRAILQLPVLYACQPVVIMSALLYSTCTSVLAKKYQNIEFC